jgi:hypothetical protein
MDMLLGISVLIYQTLITGTFSAMVKVKNLKSITKNKLMMSLIVFSLTIFTVSLFFFSLPSNLKVNESSDFHFYYQPAAINLLEGNGLTTENGVMLTRYPPGHSVFIALAIFSARVLSIDQNFGIYAFIWGSFGLISVMIFLIATQYWKDWRSIIPSLLWMTYIPALWSAKQPNSEIPFILFFLIGVWALIRSINSDNPKWLMFQIAGVIFGLSMLIRPIALPIGFILFIYVLIFLKKELLTKKFAFAACFLIGAYLPALIWGLHVKNTTGQFVLLSTSGPNAIIDGLTFSTANYDDHEDNNVIDKLSITQEFQKAFTERKPGTTSELFSIIIEKSLSNPVGIMQLFLIKAARSWYALDSMRFETYIITYQLMYLTIIIFSIVKSMKHKYIPNYFAVLTAVLVFSFWGMTITALSILRYMLPVFPLLLIFTPSIFFILQVGKSTKVDKSQVLP